MKKNKFVIEKTPARKELFERMASEDQSVARASQTAFASFLSPLIERLLNQKSTVNQFYTDMPIGKNDRQTIPLDPYVDYKEGDISIWSQTVAGGLPTNIVQGMSEFPFVFYKLYTALALDKDYVENSRLDLMARAITRVAQEFVAKQERNGWTPILAGVATANTNGQSHVINSATPGVFTIEDFNRLILLESRLYESFAGGSIDGDNGLTDLFLSPERMADIRRFAYEPMNTRGVPDSAESTALGLPDSVRRDIYTSSGASSIFGLQLNELRELGVNKKLNKIFDNFYSGTFNSATNDLVIGMNLNQDVFIRPVRTDKGGGSLVTKVDDQFFARSEKIGWYFELNEARVCLDTRAVVATII